MSLRSPSPKSCSTASATLGAFALLASFAAADGLANKCPNVHLIVDRSGSMSSSIPGGSSRWDAAAGAVKAITAKYDGKLPIGLSIFPGLGGGCDSQLVSEPKYKTGSALNAAIAASGPNGSTPSGQAVLDVSMLKSLQDTSRDQYVILVTDGGPNCSGGVNTCDGTVMQIDAALKTRKPAITTFVVGFTGGLATDEKDCLQRMATAGGKPHMGADKFYAADNVTQLNDALAEILKVVSGGGDVGGTGICDDSCYSNGCAAPGDICVAGECKPNPCSGVFCPKDSYCFSDGTAAGVCVKACSKPCPAKTRCIMGACANDPCPGACPAGLVCDANQKRCVPDQLCGMMPTDEQCKPPSACRAGKCVDNPCNFISCPSGTRCTPWEGSCDYVPSGGDTPDMAGGGETDEGGVTRGGCSTIPGGAESASLGFAGLYLLAILTARRRQRS